MRYADSGFRSWRKHSKVVIPLEDESWSESEFESKIIERLQRHGWGEVLQYKTEEELIENWANILFQNNIDRDRLNGCPLSSNEKRKLMTMVNSLATPFDVNHFINGRTITLERDNPKDTLHLGKPVSLSIYDREQIAGGKSRYQIARQPRFKASDGMEHDRRGDLMLLINGMPVIHIELKRYSVPVGEARNQIQKYLKEGKFTGLYSMVQIFVAMNPEECIYFANPGTKDINPKFCFRWTDFNNIPYKDWRDIIDNPLSIPNAHKLIGFYTVPDEGDRQLKVLRSYQITAVERIGGVIEKTHRTAAENRGGYVYHTTGSGKTLTSFKVALYIADSGGVDKSVFLADRIDLGYQTLTEYRNFASGTVDVQDTDNTDDLLSKLKSDSVSDRLIVTSIQKMGILSKNRGSYPADIELLRRKHIAFIIDECHRSTFGSMLTEIKDAFPTAIYFGFSGTPIYEENSKKDETTKDLFGSELCRYTIADGLRDGNVLGFDVRKQTMDEKVLRKTVACAECHCSEEDAMKDPILKDIYLKWTDKKRTSMKEVETRLPNSQFETDEYRKNVVDNIIEDWNTISYGNRFHALLATSSIPEAVEYYKLLRNREDIAVTAIFDDNECNTSGSFEKEEAVRMVLEDYNSRFNTNFMVTQFDLFKKDATSRISHKRQYKDVEKNPDKQLHLIIVVDQLLTGFDSRWVNALYLDKMLDNEHIIQAFSRTNRVMDEHKPFGVIKYYRRPFEMEKRIENAFSLYSGEHAADVFVSKLDVRLKEINDIFSKISDLFEDEDIEDFMRLPESELARKSFSVLFPRLRNLVISARLQDFKWDKRDYLFFGDNTIHVELTEEVFNILKVRYSELPKKTPGSGSESIPYDIDPTISEYDVESIDFIYMEARFNAFITAIQKYKDPETVARFQQELSRSFAELSQEDQEVAAVIVSDLQSGRLVVSEGESFRSILISYKIAKTHDQIHNVAESMGLDESLLRQIMSDNPKTDEEINQYNRLDALIDTIDRAKALEYLQKATGKNIPSHRIYDNSRNFLRDFIINGGFSA